MRKHYIFAIADESITLYHLTFNRLTLIPVFAWCESRVAFEEAIEVLRVLEAEGV